MMTLLSVQGMTCENCVKHVRSALTSVPGVQDVEVSLEHASASVTHDDSADVAAMIAAVEEEGYEAEAKS